MLKNISHINIYSSRVYPHRTHMAHASSGVTVARMASSSTRHIGMLATNSGFARIHSTILPYGRISPTRLRAAVAHVCCTYGESAPRGVRDRPLEMQRDFLAPGSWLGAPFGIRICD